MAAVVDKSSRRPDQSASSQAIVADANQVADPFSNASTPQADSLRSQELGSAGPMYDIGDGRMIVASEHAALSQLARLHDKEFADIAECVEGISGGRVTELNFHDFNLSYTSLLSSFTALQKLDLHGNFLEDGSLEPLRNLHELRELNLGMNEFTNLDALSGLLQLTVLSADYNRLESIEPLRTLTKLEYLDLAANHIADISALNSHAQLKYLNLGSNLVSNISALNGSTKLENLSLGENLLRDSCVSVIAGMSDLRVLDLNRNAVADIDELKNLRNLESVDLSDNDIAEISAAANWTKLSNLFLRSNRISDLSAISDLDRMPALEHVGLSGNPLGPQARDVIARMYDTGIEVAV